MVPAIAAPVQYWFVNNHVDWDKFNTLDDKDFEVKRTCITNKVAA